MRAQSRQADPLRNIATAQPQLIRTLNFWQVTASGVGIVVGAGIYVLVGSAAEEAGNAVWLAFGVAALLSGLTALSYAELASLFPSAGVEYEYGRRAFNEFVGFIAGWMMIAAYMVAAGAVSLGFAHYVQHFVDVDVRVAAIALLCVLTLIVISGIERSIWLSVALAVVQLGGLVIVIWAGLPHAGDRSLLEGGSVPGVFSAAALVFFAFIGFDDIATLSEETVDASNVMPRALMATLAIASVLYMLVGISAVSVVGGDALAASDTPLALVLEHDLGAWAGDLVAWIALASTTNTTLLVLTASSRLVFGMGRTGALPRRLAAVLPRTGAPWVAALASLVVAASFAMAGDIGTIASVTDFSVYVIFITVNLSVVALRFRMPDTPRRFAVPLAVRRVPLPTIGAIATIVILLLFLEPSAWWLGAGAILAGVAAWFVTRAIERRQPLAAAG